MNVILLQTAISYFILSSMDYETNLLNWMKTYLKKIKLSLKIMETKFISIFKQKIWWLGKQVVRLMASADH